MDKKFFEELLRAPSPSGYEKAALRVWDKKCQESGLTHEFSDHQGNSVWSKGSGPVKVLLSAHIDEISARVSYISDQGIISIINVAGMDRKVLPGSKVLIILDDDSTIPGIIGKLPIHLEKPEDRDNTTKFSGLKVMTGAETKEAVLESGIHIGCPVILPRDSIMGFGPNQVCSQGLDDKSGIFVLSELFSMTPRDEYTIYFAALGSEEIGTYGGTIVSQRVKPGIAINLDVTFASDGDYGVQKEEDGDIALGKGCVIEYGPDKDFELGNELLQIAKEKEIPYQLAASWAGGTDTCVIRRFGGDLRTMLISIPSINMHTAVEVVDYRDLQSAVDLIKSYLGK